jgi:hypothetical protein
MTTDDAEIEATLEALVNISSRRVFEMLAEQGQTPDPALVQTYLADLDAQLRLIPRSTWLEATGVRLPAELHDALPEALRASVGAAIAAEILRHVHQYLSPVLLLLASQTWNLCMANAARVAAESRAAGARRH